MITDGWSGGIIVRELSALYRGFALGEAASLPALPIQYADYAAWQRRWLAGENLARQLDYWRAQLAGLEASELPADRPRPAVETYRGTRRPAALTPRLTASLHALARGAGATLYMVLLAAFDALVASYTGRTDVVVGSPVANRSRRETEGVIGFFINTLVMRVSTAGDPSLCALLDRVRETALAAYVHEDVPFEKVVEELQPQRDLSRNPLFQVMVAVQNVPQPPMELPGLAVSPRQLDLGLAKFDLTMVWEEVGEQVSGHLEYSTELFDPTTVERLLAHYRTLLERAVAAPDQPVGSLAGPTAAERHQIVEEWNDTSTAFRPSRSVHEWMQEQAAATPGALALVAGETELTYRELNGMANRLAHWLRRQGVGPDVLVGICVDRNWSMVVSLLGVLKAGGAALAIDLTYPEERQRYVIEDAGLALLITEDKMLPQLPDTGIPRWSIDAEWPRLDGESEADPEPWGSPDCAMYALYTSGSTGLPKGVIYPHRAFVNLLEWHFRDSGLAPRARTVQFSTFGFCMSFFEIFSVLCSGATLVMIPEEHRRDMEALWRFLEENEIERLHIPFSALKQLADVWGEVRRAPARLREIVTTGEQLQIDRSLRGLFSQLKGCSLYNQYGASEIHVVSHFRLPETPAGWPDISPVGRPIANNRVYVLDRHLQPVASGVMGEVYAGGACLARGYLGAPERTAQKLVPDPFAARQGEAGARLYRTGDLARFLPDGRIEWFGRADSQVKIRGFRVELGEVETAVKQHPLVRNAAVLARPGAGTPRLVAYVVPHPGQAMPADLRAFLKGKLPEQAVPVAFVEMAALPLNANGKLDQKELPDLTAGTGEEGFVPPDGPVEEVVAQIWCKVLDLPRVGAHDDFFALGGHSLLATQVVNRMRRNLAVELPLRALFEGPTVAELARAVTALEARPGLAAKLARAFLAVRTMSRAEVQEQLRASRGGGVAEISPAAVEGPSGPPPAAPSEQRIDLQADERAALCRLRDGVSLDPADDFERFAFESKLVFHQLPERLRRGLLEFGRRGNLDGVLLLRGLAEDAVLPPTPTRGSDAVRKATFASELWLCVAAAAFGELVGYQQYKGGLIIQDIFPTPAEADKQSSESSSTLLAFHTELTFHPFSPDYVLLFGLRPDPDQEARTMFAGVRRVFPRLSPADRDVLFDQAFRTGLDYSFGNLTTERGTGPLLSVLYG
ncbi:MAG TPA: amino acid adenylation domain-containing protein, partial [Solirubrobacterales bacterium]|nr:amino acid adenylation domain-containing protein [Solirubrobacterales bacterium]